MSNAAGTAALAWSVAAARLTSRSLKLVATRAATKSPDTRAVLTMKRRLGAESVLSAVGDSPWLVDRRRSPLSRASCAVGRTEMDVLRSVINDSLTANILGAVSSGPFVHPQPP